MTSPPPELVEWLHRYDPAVQSLALSLRRVVLEEMAPCHEYVFAMRSAVVLLYGPTEHVMRDGICHISVLAKHVNLQFRRGIDLRDKYRVLRGTGKAMRHLTLNKLSELDRPEIREYLREARRNAGLRRSRPPTVTDVITRVKGKTPSRVASRPRPTKAWDQFGMPRKNA